MKGGALVKAILNRSQKVIAWLVLAVMVIGGAVEIYSQYPNMKTQANRWAGNFFESYSFLDSLSDGVQYLGFEMSGDIITRDEVPSDVEYGGDWINLCGNDLDYYVKSSTGEKTLERNGALLAQVLEGKKEISSKELKSQYQYVVEFQFDQEGKEAIKQIYGGDRVSTEQFLNDYDVFYNYQAKDMSMIFGVPKELSSHSFFANQLQYHLEEGYVIAVIPYLIVGTAIVVLITFIVPFAWFERLAIVRGLMVVPLELRFLFVIGTCFAVIGAPFLLIFTQSGYLLEAIDYYFGMNRAQWIVTAINLICWGGFIGVITLHALYLKEFFIIGPWQMIRRHTILGQLIWLWRRPKVVTKTMVEEKVVIEEDPRVAVITSQLALFRDTLSEMKPRLEEVKGVDEVIEQLDSLMNLCDLNQPLQPVNVTKLISDTMVLFEERFVSLEVKTRFPKETIFVTSHEASMKLLMETLLGGIADEALPHSRVYLEVVYEEQFIVFVTRSVLKDEVDVKLLATLEALVQQQRGVFESVIDGDLMKLTLKFKK